MKAMEFDGARMRLAREGAGFGQREFARVLGLSPGYVCQLETGHRSPSPHRVRKIAAALSVSVEWLCGGEPTPALPSPLAMFSDAELIAEFARRSQAGFICLYLGPGKHATGDTWGCTMTLSGMARALLRGIDSRIDVWRDEESQP